MRETRHSTGLPQRTKKTSRTPPSPAFSYARNFREVSSNRWFRLDSMERRKQIQTSEFAPFENIGDRDAHTNFAYSSSHQHPANMGQCIEETLGLSRQHVHRRSRSRNLRNFERKLRIESAIVGETGKSLFSRRTRRSGIASGRHKE